MHGDDIRRFYVVAAADADLRRDKPWVSLGGHGDGRPLFLLHPLSGETSCDTQLAERLAISRPLVGLRSPALFDPKLHTQPLADIAVAARREARLLVADVLKP